MPELNNVNTRALKAAAELLIGSEGYTLIEKLYHALDQAEYAGFEDGSKEGFTLAAEIANANADYAESEAYDDGYLQGVKDVRLDPNGADAVVEEIIACRQDSGDEFCGDFYEGDSGDENDYPSVR
jgi:hypothetical protein